MTELTMIGWAIAVGLIIVGPIVALCGRGDRSRRLSWFDIPRE